MTNHGIKVLLLLWVPVEPSGVFLFETRKLNKIRKGASRMIRIIFTMAALPARIVSFIALPAPTTCATS